MVDANNVAIPGTLPVSLDSNSAPTKLIVGPSTDTTLTVASPYTIKLKALVAMNTVSVAYETFSVVFTSDPCTTASISRTSPTTLMYTYSYRIK